MTPDQASTLLTSITGYTTMPQGSQMVDVLLESLEQLPLAITQAASYISETKLSYQEYLTRYRQQRKRWRLLATDRSYPFRQDGASNSVMDTWLITMDHLHQQYPAAAQILKVVSWYHNRNLPRLLLNAVGRHHRMNHSHFSASDNKVRLIRRQTDQRDWNCDRSKHTEPSRFLEEDGDSDDRDEDEDQTRLALMQLERFSFLRLQSSISGKQTYDIHKLVQEVARHASLPESRDGAQTSLADVALDILLQNFPTGDYGTWEECEALLSHATTICDREELQKRKSDVICLLQRASVYLIGRERWSEVEKVLIKILQLQRDTIGEEHDDTNLSMITMYMTKYLHDWPDEAQATLSRLVTVRKEAVGELHIDNAGSFQDLSILYCAQKRYIDAEVCVNKVLQLRKEVLGERHPNTLCSMARFAEILSSQGRLTDAEAMHIEAITLHKKVLGNKHLDTLKSMESRAMTMCKQEERLKDAEAAFSEVIAIRKEVQGRKHPTTIWSMAWWALTILHQEGRMKDAEAAYIEVIALQKEVHGDKHRQTLRSMVNLARIYWLMTFGDQQQPDKMESGLVDKSNEAEAIYLQLIPLQKEVLGEHDRRTGWTMESIGKLYYHQGRMEEAREHLVEALEVFRVACGEKHPETLETAELLAEVISRIDKRDGCEREPKRMRRNSDSY